MKRFSLKSGLLIATVLTGFISNSIQAQDLTSANLLIKSEQYDKAEAMLQQLIQKEPNNSKYFFFLGENYLLDFFADTISNSLAEYTNRQKRPFKRV